MKIIGVVGSKRKKGNTSALVNTALEAAKQEGADVEVIYLGEHEIKGCTGCEGCRTSYACVIQDGMQAIYPKLMAADGLIAGTPTYFYNMSSDMKAFIERLYCYEGFDADDRAVWMSVFEAMGGKLAATISICEQHDAKDMGVTAEAMDLSFASLGYRIVESVKVLELYEAGAAQRSATAMDQARRAGEKLVKTLQLREQIRRTL